MRSDVLTTHHAIKVLALVSMTIDHFGAFLYPDEIWLRAAGRVFVPVWFFLVGHALTYTTRRELLLWAGVLAVASPFAGMPVFPLNNLVTILFCQAVLRQVERRDLLAREPAMLMLAATLFALPTMLCFEYGTVGMLFALLGHAVRSGQMQWRTGKAVAVLAFVLYLGSQYAIFQFGAVVMGFVTASTGAVMLYLIRFRHRPVVLTRWSRPLAPVTVWSSRHSLQYYVIHRLLLQMAGVVRGVLSPAFQWI